MMTTRKERDQFRDALRALADRVDALPGFPIPVNPEICICLPYVVGAGQRDPDPDQQYADELAALDEIARILGTPVEVGEGGAHARVAVSFGTLTVKVVAIAPRPDERPVDERVAALIEDTRELTAELAGMSEADRLAAFENAWGPDEIPPGPPPAPRPRGCVVCREAGPRLTAPGTSGRDWKCAACGTAWQGPPPGQRAENAHPEPEQDGS